MYEWGEWKHKWHLKVVEEKKKVLCKPQTSCWQIPWGLQDVCLTWLDFPSCLLDVIEILANVASCNGLFYFFLPKKLNLFSRSLSFPSLLRMVTPPPSAELGEMGGMVMARLSALGPPGESPGPDGTEPRMERIQALISAWGVKKVRLNFPFRVTSNPLVTSPRYRFHRVIPCLTSSFAWNRYSFPSPSLQRLLKNPVRSKLVTPFTLLGILRHPPIFTWAWRRVSSSYSHEPPHTQPQRGWWAPLRGMECHCLHFFHLCRSQDFLFLRHSRHSARTYRNNEKIAGNRIDISVWIKAWSTVCHLSNILPNSLGWHGPGSCLFAVWLHLLFPMQYPLHGFWLRFCSAPVR